ncbi:MAG: hypothetical protein O3C51_18355, partial [Planctomycetota bacterium]|nr:hypothetical protein [Planctomycetota bacterium]
MNTIVRKSLAAGFFACWGTSIVLGQSAYTWNSPASAPSPTISPTMAFDPNAGEAVLIGGFSFETRVWDGTAWQAYPGNPAPLTGAPLVFDGQSILAVSPGTTHRWSNNSWQSLTAPTPSYGGFRVAYDEARRRVLGFGGTVTPFSMSSETWEWDGRTWTQLSPATTPQGR